MQPTNPIQIVPAANVVLDPIQRHYIEQIDPSYVNAQEQSQSMLEQLGQTALLERLKAGIARTDGLPPDPQAIPAPTTAPAQGSVEGGFAIAPLIPLLAPLVGPLINGITSLFKPRQGAGSRAPNAVGAGSRAPNGGLSYTPVPKDVLLDRQRSLITKRGRAFWDELLGQAEDAIVEGLVNAGDVNAEQAKAIAGEMLAHVVPPSFVEYIRTNAKDASRVTSKGGLTLGTVVKPLMKWGAMRLLNDYQRPDVRQGIHDYADHLNNRMLWAPSTSSKALGSGRASNWFRKILGYAKKGLATVLPLIAPIAKQLAPGAIDGVMREFNLTNDPIASTIARVAKQAIAHSPAASSDASPTPKAEASGTGRRTLASKKAARTCGSGSGTKRPKERKTKIHRVAGFRLERVGSPADD